MQLTEKQVKRARGECPLQSSVDGGQGWVRLQHVCTSLPALFFLLPLHDLEIEEKGLPLTLCGRIKRKKCSTQ